jgi:hypothetical protein
MTMTDTTPTPHAAGDEHPVLPGLTQPVRAWIYRCSTAVTTLAGGYGLITDNKAALVLGCVAAFLSLPVAVANTPTGR